MEATKRMAQINVRLEQSVKDAGTDALANIGLSPSAAIRALWEKAAKRGKHLEEIRALLFDDAQCGSAASERLFELENARMRVIDTMEELGVKDLSTPPEGFEKDDDAIFSALMERMEERRLA